jgi:hypothetical protein
MPLFIKNPRPRPGDLLLFRADRFYFPAEDTNLALEFNIYVPEIVLALGTYESFKNRAKRKLDCTMTLNTKPTKFSRVKVPISSVNSPGQKAG